MNTICSIIPTLANAPNNRVGLKSNNNAAITSMPPRKILYGLEAPIVLQYKISFDKYPIGVNKVLGSGRKNCHLNTLLKPYIKSCKAK